MVETSAIPLLALPYRSAKIFLTADIAVASKVLSFPKVALLDPFGDF